METLQDKIDRDFRHAIKTRNREAKSNLNVLMGELDRQSTKVLSDTQVVKIVKSLIKSEKENLVRTNNSSSCYLSLLENYIPKQIEEKEIIDWIKENIDFSKFTNRMQAMRPIMQHFGTTVSGSIVKRLILKL